MSTSNWRRQDVALWMLTRKRRDTNSYLNDMPNFQKIIDIISGALYILDFSYIISGAVTYLIIMFSLHYHGVNLDLMKDKWFIHILFAYVSGVLSWLVGRFICKSIRDKVGTFDTVFDEWKYLVINQLPADIRRFTNKQLYTYFWIELDKKAPERANFVNRFWVMQAMLEGLVASCLVGLVILFELYCTVGENFWGKYTLLLIFPLLILIYLLYASAKEQASYQIKEVILGYKSYCLSSNEL